MINLKYSGTLQSKEIINQLVDELIDISRISGWEYSLIKDNFLTLTMKTSSSNESIIKDLEAMETRALSSSEVFLEGISIKIKPDYEPLRITFDKTGRLSTIAFLSTKTSSIQKKLTIKKYEFLYYPFVKVHTMGAEYHIQVVKLLDYIKKKYVKDLEVIDSSFFWETRDDEMLRVKIWKSSIRQKSR
ncbi:MAG: hypothetical protein WCJ94_03195 [bacterium]